MSIERKYHEAARLVCIARDYLRQHWDMTSAPLSRIDKFTTRYLESDKRRSGRILIRIPPSLHTKLSSQAKRNGKSLNALILEMIKP